MDHLIPLLSDYRQEHVCKILGVGITADLHKESPNLCSRLWAELDIVPMVVSSNEILPSRTEKSRVLEVDELADSAARKCLA